MKFIFWLFTACASVAAILIYGVYFDSFSERELMSMSFIWFLPFIFGVYGLVTMRFMPNENAESVQPPSVVQSAKKTSLALVLGQVVGSIPILGALVLVLLLPLFASQKLKSPFLIALTATAIWAVLLFVFLAVIFPLL